MTELTTFHYHDAAVRTQRDDSGEPLFCLADVCKVLELNGTENTARQLREEFSDTEHPVLNTDSLITLPVDTGRGVKELVFLTEPQLYFVMMRSRSERAKPFRQWVVSEVLPAIRKTGHYEVTPSGSKMPMDELQGFLGVIKTVLEPAGIVGNQLTLALDKAVKAETGKSALALTGVQLEAPTQTHLLTPTDLGKSLGLSAVAVNKKLAAMGYQTKTDNGWELTAKGIEAGGVFLDTNKRHSNGTPIRQLKWPANIASQLST